MPRLPIDYNNTIIYKIVCNDLNVKDIYVGHTTDFIRRKNQHKNNCYCSSCNYKLYSIIRQYGGWDNWIMIEIEKYPCNDVNEARARERHWYELFNATLNSQKPLTTDEEKHERINEYNKQYYAENKMAIIENVKNYTEKNKTKKDEYQKKYRDEPENKARQNHYNKKYLIENKKELIEYQNNYYKNNKEKVMKNRCKEYICECGCKIQAMYKYKHKKTTKHFEMLEKLKINI